MTSQAQIKASRKYNDRMTWQYNLKFNHVTDLKVILKLQKVENRTNYIRQLILADIDSNKTSKPEQDQRI